MHHVSALLTERIKVLKIDFLKRDLSLYCDLVVLITTHPNKDNTMNQMTTNQLPHWGFTTDAVNSDTSQRNMISHAGCEHVWQVRLILFKIVVKKFPLPY